MYLSEIEPHEIDEIVRNLGSNKAGDIYGNTGNLVKFGGPVLNQIMTLLFNKSLEQGIFPSPLKVSKILPIHKGDSVFEMSNYRPISLLNTWKCVRFGLCFLPFSISLFLLELFDLVVDLLPY